jgi:hypothetical protein
MVAQTHLNVPLYVLLLRCKSLVSYKHDVSHISFLLYNQLEH